MARIVTVRLALLKAAPGSRTVADSGSYIRAPLKIPVFNISMVVFFEPREIEIG